MSTTTRVPQEELDRLHAEMRAAQAAWERARRVTTKVPGDRTQDPEIVRTARAAARAEGEFRTAKLGVARRALPKGHQHCTRCGGFGGSSQWPGYVCFGCDGAGTVEA